MISCDGRAVHPTCTCLLLLQACWPDGTRAVWASRDVIGKYKFMTTDNPAMLKDVDMFFWTAISGRGKSSVLRRTMHAIRQHAFWVGLSCGLATNPLHNRIGLHTG